MLGMCISGARGFDIMRQENKQRLLEDLVQNIVKIVMRST